MRRVPRNICLSCLNLVKFNSRKYCSSQCQRDSVYQAFIVAWKAGQVHGRCGFGVSGWIKRYLIEKYGEKCSACGWDQRNPTTNKVPIQVEHKDGNWENNSEENLCLLCPNCHSLTTTYGALNMGHGRKLRSKYALKKLEGQSGHWAA